VEKRVLAIAIDDNVPPAVALAAEKDALDRARISTKSTVGLNISVKPWEQVYTKLTAGSREDYRRSIGKGSDHGETDEVETGYETEIYATDSGTGTTESQTKVSPDSEDALIEAGWRRSRGLSQQRPIDVEILSDEPDRQELISRMVGSDHRSISMRSGTTNWDITSQLTNCRTMRQLAN
jgi:hypothetical protein